MSWGCAPHHSNGRNHETYVSAKQKEARQDPRFSCPHGNQGRTPGIGSPPRQGPQEPDSLGPTVSMETIKSKQDFERVFSRGRRYGSSLVRVTVLQGDENVHGRVAFVAAKRLGNAVFRNRCKRVLREAARMCGLPKDGADILMFATHGTHDASPAEVADALGRLLRKARVS